VCGYVGFSGRPVVSRYVARFDWRFEAGAWQLGLVWPVWRAFGGNKMEPRVLFWWCCFFRWVLGELSVLFHGRCCEGGVSWVLWGRRGVLALWSSLFFLIHGPTESRLFFFSGGGGAFQCVCVGETSYGQGGGHAPAPGRLWRRRYG